MGVEVSMEGVWHGWGYFAGVIMFLIIMGEISMIRKKQGGANGFAWLISNIFIFVMSLFLAIVTLIFENFQTALSFLGYAVGFLFIEIIVSIGLFYYFISRQK